MQSVAPYRDLKHTLQCLKLQVIDSLPFIHQYIPEDIETPEELFYFLKEEVVGDGKGVTYEKDPPGRELLQSVQTLIDNNKHGLPGAGDCDCFTILVLASCHYLGFKPQYVRLVGRSKNSPSHIYSLVYDRDKKKVCAMDLTNPTYCMERKYAYKQTLDFMILELADGFPLASKASRQAKKAARTQIKIAKSNAKVAKKAAKVQRKVVRAENKTARITSRQTGRTERGDTRREGKLKVAQRKTARKDNKLIRAKGRGEIIQARQSGRLDKVKQSFLPQPEAEEADYEEQEMYSPEDYPSNESAGGGAYEEEDEQDDENYAEYELMPEAENDEEYAEEEEEEEELEDGFIFQAAKGLKKLIQKGQAKVSNVKAKAQATKAGQALTATQENSLLKGKIVVLEKQLEAEKKNKYYYGGGGFAGGTLTGILLKSLIK